MLRQDNAGAEVASAPALVGRDEFQLAIPWRGGLHQSPPPLHQPGAVCSKLSLPVEEFTVNGELSLNCLSHPRGQAHCGVSSIEQTRQRWVGNVQSASLVEVWNPSDGDEIKNGEGGYC